MTDLQIEQLSQKFRTAIEDAICAREHWTYDGFYNFPRGCCGFTSDLCA